MTKSQRASCWMAFVAAALFFFCVSSALAQQQQPQQQPQCGPTDKVIQFLMERYEEVPLWAGKMDNGVGLIMFVNPKTRTWTMATANDQGVSCYMVTGKDGATVVPSPTGSAKGA